MKGEQIRLGLFLSVMLLDGSDLTFVWSTHDLTKNVRALTPQNVASVGSSSKPSSIFAIVHHCYWELVRLDWIDWGQRLRADFLELEVAWGIF